MEAEPPQALVDLVQMAEDVRALAIILWLVALLAIAAALWLSPNRREAIRRGAIGLAVGASLMLVALWVLRSRLIGTLDDSMPPGCNGHPDLCKRTLPEVVFPTTHNSFSAADQENWLFAQHESGIAAQLRGGVRGFLIDTHWGRRTADGSVITDLSQDNKTHQQYVEEFGQEVVEAALRVRDSLKQGAQTAGPPEIYLCHGFCEVGARRLEDDLVAMRDFLVANPNQVLVVIVQNEGVNPEDFPQRSRLRPRVRRRRPSRRRRYAAGRGEAARQAAASRRAQLLGGEGFVGDPVVARACRLRRGRDALDCLRCAGTSPGPGCLPAAGTG